MQQLPPEVLDTKDPFDADLLDAAIYGVETVDLPVEPTQDEITDILGWTPPDLEYADWAGRKWVANRAEADEIDRIAKEQIERIKAWQAAEKARLDRKLSWLESVLQRFAIARRVATNNATTKLPSVTISTRRVAAGVDVVNEAEAIAWAEERKVSGVVKVTKSFRKSDIPKEYLDAIALVEEGGESVARFIDPNTGEPIPGLQPRSAGLSASIKPAS